MTVVGRPLTSTVSGWPPLRDNSTRAWYFSFRSMSNMRKHLAREQLHALACQLVRQGPRLAPRQHHAAPQLLLILFQFLPHRRRAADDGKDALLHVVPGLLLIEEILLVFQQCRGRS